MPPLQTKREDLKKGKDDGPPDLAAYHEIIDPATFEQILEMDDDSEREFSKEIVDGFFDQAESTFEQMEEALSSNDFDELSQLGHFLKGSSATLGLTKVKDACEKIQHCKEEISTKGDETERQKAIDGIKQTLTDVQEDYNEVADVLRRFYGEKPKNKNKK